MPKHFTLLPILFLLVISSCETNTQGKAKEQTNTKQYYLSLDRAEALASLPLKCMNQEYPNKLNQTLGDSTDLNPPQVLHPAFYGCFDWHSAVHGHWSLVKLLKSYPELRNGDSIRERLRSNLSTENILVEVEYFNKPLNKSYERTYGWAWLLKLAEELHTWDDSLATELSANLKPLTELIVNRYIEFLPKLEYPIRVGTHTNTAFGLTFAHDYAVTTDNTDLKEAIEQKAKSFYTNDKICPLGWEPGGYDFLSPCLEEIDLMRRVLNNRDFHAWMHKFAPEMGRKNFDLEPGRISDRQDGHLVHLDGLNFSRAWVLYGLANASSKYEHLKAVADKHVQYSLPNLIEDTYEGGHWLGSFAIYALDQKK